MALAKRKIETPWRRLMSTREVSEYLNVHPNTVRIWSSSGLLPAYRVGPRSNRKFKIEDVEKFLQEHSETQIGVH